MLLTRNDAALRIVVADENDGGLLGSQKPLVIFGSDFPADKSDLHIYMNIQR